MELSPGVLQSMERIRLVPELSVFAKGAVHGICIASYQLPP